MGKLSFNNYQSNNLKNKIYNVRKIKSNIDFSRRQHSIGQWQRANILNNFCSPWQSITNSETEFKALWNTDYLFFCFEVWDHSIHIDNTDNTYKSINESDRVELFFRKNTSMMPYYCLEIDPTPRVMDFKALPNKNFNFQWNWPKSDITTTSDIDNTGYKISGKISIASLNALNLIQNGKIETGIFRAKYYKTNDSTYKPVWITWVDPKTKVPNFHTPDSFGVLKLEDF